MPLRMRLSLLFALATAVALTIAGLAFVAQLQVSVDASLDPGLRAQLADVADDLGAGDPEPVGPGTLVQVVAPDGRVLSSSAGTAALLTDTQRRQALGGETSFTAQIGADRTRVLAAPATRAGAPVVVAVAARTVVSDVAVERVELALLLGAPVAVLLAGVGAWLLAGAALRPVERMRREAAEISDRDLDRRLGVPATRDEIAALGTTINALLARLQEALHRERGFVADAGHELRTPLAILRAELELAARPGRSREALVDAINEAGAETDRLIRLAEDLLLLARADNHQPFLRLRRLSRARPAARRGARRGDPGRRARGHRRGPRAADPGRRGRPRPPAPGRGQPARQRHPALPARRGRRAQRRRRAPRRAHHRGRRPGAGLPRGLPAARLRPVPPRR